MLPVRVAARGNHRQPAQRPQQDVRGRAAMARRLCDVAELVHQHHQHAKRAPGDEHEREGRDASSQERQERQERREDGEHQNEHMQPHGDAMAAPALWELQRAHAHGQRHVLPGRATRDKGGQHALPGCATRGTGVHAGHGHTGHDRHDDMTTAADRSCAPAANDR